jgi:hypothetical protein
VALLNLPLGHCKQALPSFGEYLPGPQILHSAEPSATVEEPFGHLLHDLAYFSVVNWPMGHRLHFGGFNVLPSVYRPPPSQATHFPASAFIVSERRGGKGKFL